MTNLLVFGASSTLGFWDKEKGGWVNRLRLYCDSNYDDLDVYNLGISGDNTQGLLERMETEIKARLGEKETIIIISIGDNDSTKNSPVYIPKEKFEENLQRIIDMVKKFSDKIILLGTKAIDESKTNPVPWDKSVFYTNKNLKEYDEIIKQIVEKNRLYYIEMFSLLDKEDLEDGLHPNSKGHKKIFKKVKDFLIKNKII